MCITDERASGAGTFLSLLGAKEFPPRQPAPPTVAGYSPSTLKLFCISDASGRLTFSPVSDPPSFSALSSSDAFLVDASHFSASESPALYVWIGRDASLAESRLSLQYAQKYLHKKQSESEGFADDTLAVPIIRVRDGLESDAFLDLFRSKDASRDISFTSASACPISSVRPQYLDPS